jgi:CheY-like chemotaxis protein
VSSPVLGRPIVVIEDSDEDFEMLCWIFAKLGLQHPLVRCVTGDEALEYFKQKLAPLLILLDLNLPGTDGREVLSEIKTDPILRCTPVIVLTTSSNPRDVRQSYAAGANAYMIKPVNLEKLSADLKAFCEYWLQAVILPETEEVEQ